MPRQFVHPFNTDSLPLGIYLVLWREKRFGLERWSAPEWSDYIDWDGDGQDMEPVMVFGPLDIPLPRMEDRKPEPGWPEPVQEMLL